MLDPRNDLERLFVAAARDPDQRTAFGKAVLEAQLYVSPLAEPDADGRVPGVRRAALPGDGVTAAAVFTSPEQAFEQFGEEILILQDTGRVFLEWLRPGPVILNPGHTPSLVWDAEALSSLLDGMVTQVLDADLHVRLGQPKDRPEALIERLKAAFEGDGDIAEAFLLLMQREDTLSPSWLIGVRSSGPWSAVQHQVGAALEGLKLTEPLDVINLDDGDGLTASVRTGIPLVAARTTPSATAPSPTPPLAAARKKRGLFNFFRKD